jgi:hypothetical protein
MRRRLAGASPEPVVEEVVQRPRRPEEARQRRFLDAVVEEGARPFGG